jgi:hypothetical protein
MDHWYRDPNHRIYPIFFHKETLARANSFQAVEFQLFFFRGNQPASQAMPPTRAKIPKTKAQSRRANGKLMTI